MKTGCGGGRCQQGGPAPHGGEHGAAGSPAQQNRPGVRRRAGALLTADLTAAADEGAVIYRRRKQRMPSAIRARKAQHGAAPTQSPAPEAQASMRMSTAGRASTAEPGIRQGWRPLCPQHARQIGRQAAQTGGSGGRKKERRGGCGCGRGPVPGAQQGEHQSAQRRGTRKQAGRAQRQPSYQNAQVRPAGQPPRSPAYAPGAEIVRVSVYIHKFLNIKINIQKFNIHIENLCKNNRAKLEKLCKMILE